MAAEKEQASWLGKHTFPLIWVWICVLFNVFGILALIMLIIAEFVILANDFNNYVDQYGHHYSARNYDFNSGCGFVPYSNAPTHLGSAIWMLFYQLSIVVLALLTVGSDLAWRTAQAEFGGRYVSGKSSPSFFAIGIMSGEHNKGLFYYVVANGFLKLFVVVLYMSQSFYGLSGGSHTFPHSDGTWSMSSGSGSGSSASSSSSSWSSSSGGASSGSGSSASSSSSSSASSWARDFEIIGGDSDRSHGTELWAFWAGWIVLGSIVPSIIAFMFLVPWAAAKKEEKPSAEAPKPPSRSQPSPPDASGGDGSGGGGSGGGGGGSGGGSPSRGDPGTSGQSARRRERERQRAAAAAAA